MALAKYIWKVLKNRSNEIRSNEIRIRRELPVDFKIMIIMCKEVQIVYSTVISSELLPTACTFELCPAT